MTQQHTNLSISPPTACANVPNRACNAPFEVFNLFSRKQFQCLSNKKKHPKLYCLLWCLFSLLLFQQDRAWGTGVRGERGLWSHCQLEVNKSKPLINNRWILLLERFPGLALGGKMRRTQWAINGARFFLLTREKCKQALHNSDSNPVGYSNSLRFSSAFWSWLPFH